MFIFTFIFYLLFRRKFLRTELFADEDYNFEETHIEEWHKKFTHPMDDLNYNDDTFSAVRSEEIELIEKDI